MTSLSRRATNGDVEVPASGRRRRFTVEYKTRIVQEAAQCRAAGEIGSLLRREGLFSSLAPAARERAVAGPTRARRAVDRDPKKTLSTPGATPPQTEWKTHVTAALQTHGATLGVARLSAALGVPRFVDRAPAQVHATLLDEGTYVCSVRTL